MSILYKLMQRHPRPIILGPHVLLKLHFVELVVHVIGGFTFLLKNTPMILWSLQNTTSLVLIITYLLRSEAFLNHWTLLISHHPNIFLCCNEFKGFSNISFTRGDFYNLRCDGCICAYEKDIDLLINKFDKLKASDSTFYYSKEKNNKGLFYAFFFPINPFFSGCTTVLRIKGKNFQGS